MGIPKVEPLALGGHPDAYSAFLADPAQADGRFANPWGAGNTRGPMDVLRWKFGAKSAFADAKRSRPVLPLAPDPAGLWRAAEPGARVQWLGHASVLVEIDGVTVLIDPVFGRAGVVPRAAPAPLRPDQLPPIQAVLLTHGHYDHLDRASLAAVAKANPDALFVTPLGQQGSLPRACRRVVALNWWQQVRVEGLRLILVPAQHWHQRSAVDRDRALWGGYCVQGSRSLYHSGDTGSFGGFKVIGDVLGAPDVAVLPLGAYEPRWFMSEQHMGPEDSLQAYQDLGAANLLAMHWGTFDLTDEPLDHGSRVMLPRIAEERGLDRDRLHVLAHGGVLGFREPARPVPLGRAPSP